MVKGGRNKPAAKAAPKQIVIEGIRASSIEEYVEICCESGIVAALFDKPSYFKELYEKGIIQPEISFIRIHHVLASDNCYAVRHGGWLEGLELNNYSGEPGNHKYTELLSEKNAPEGWEVEGIIPPNFRRPQTLDAALK